MSLPELQRREFVNSILNDLDDTVANTVEELRSILVGSIPGPITTVPQDSWNAERFQASPVMPPMPQASFGKNASTVCRKASTLACLAGPAPETLCSPWVTI